MKANELRIGNYFVDAKDRLCSVDEISKDIDDCRISSIYDCITTHPIQPIPLTEEWLVKFGFEFINNEFYRSQNSELCLYLTVNKNKMIPEYNGKRLVTGYDFKHVHQLQNLYFALTGEELTFKSE